MAMRLQALGMHSSLRLERFQWVRFVPFGPVGWLQWLRRKKTPEAGTLHAAGARHKKGCNQPVGILPY